MITAGIQNKKTGAISDAERNSLYLPFNKNRIIIVRENRP